MEVKDLTDLGFNKNEAKVYLSLVKFGKADAHQLIQDTKFHKNIVYDNLDKLMDKGLVSYVIEMKRRVFKLVSSNMIIEFFEEQERELKNRKKKARIIVKEIDETLKKVKYPQEATIYRGTNGIRSFYNESLEDDYVVFGAPQESLQIMGETFWQNFNTKRIAKKIKVKMIFNSNIRSYGDKIKNKFTEIRYFDKEFEPLTETHIQKDKVGIIVWTEEPILFLIQDKSVSDSYLKFFEDMWKTTTK
tara:strand:- start:203 stop:940 length:738 start_codon:yes stop_codon:yes gene_type:complete